MSEQGHARVSAAAGPSQPDDSGEAGSREAGEAAQASPGGRGESARTRAESHGRERGREGDAELKGHSGEREPRHPRGEVASVCAGGGALYRNRSLGREAAGVGSSG